MRSLRPGAADSGRSAADAGGVERARARWLTRRRLVRAVGLGAAVTAVAAFGLVIDAFYGAPYRIEYHDVEIGVADLPAAFDGFTIAHVSDIHCGRLLGPERVRAMFDRVRERKPDIVAVTGDLVYGGDAYPKVLHELARAAREVPTYVVPGNHDYWEGSQTYRKGVPAAGAVDLTNAHRVIEREGARLVLAGVDDLWAGRPDLERALRGVQLDTQPVILLMHNPDFFEKVRRKGVDLVLAGHTHGGQVKPPFMAPPVLPVKHRKYASGLFREQGTAMYVSRGVGMIMQLRFNCPPEVAFIVLREAGTKR